MKKYCFPLLLALVMTMTACDLTKTDSTSSDSSNHSAAVLEQSEDGLRCTVGDISFLVDESWTPMDGIDGAFSTVDGKAAYQLQGNSMLGSFTPDEFYQTLLESYTETYEIIHSDNELTALTLSDGAEAHVGRIEITDDNILYSIDVVLVPQKNKALTFAVQTAEGNTAPVDIREVSSTVIVNIGSEDYISGNTFLVDDGSQLCLKEDNSFVYYQYADDHDGAYTSGTYEVYYGQAAIDKAVSLTEYGLEEEELEQILTANMNGYSLNADLLAGAFTEEVEETYHICRDTFYVVILRTTLLKDSEGELEMDDETMYIGHYLPDLEFADMVNTYSANYAGWTLQGATE